MTDGRGSSSRPSQCATRILKVSVGGCWFPVVNRSDCWVQ